jgi:hypothetical protein
VQEHKKQGGHGGHYGRLAAMIVLSFIAMYALMYGMVNAFAIATYMMWNWGACPEARA